MAHKTLINGTSYEISGGKTLINGTAYSIDKGKTLVGSTVYDVGFGTPISILTVGSTIKFNTGSTLSNEFIIVHQGKPSNIYDDSCDGTWLMSKALYVTLRYGDGSYNNYEKNGLHGYLNNSYYNNVLNRDPDVQGSIKTVRIPYFNNNGIDGELKTGSSGLETKCFLLSGYEVGFTKAYDGTDLIADGAVLDYFYQGGSRVAYHSTTVKNWWLRTPSKGYNKMMTIVDTNGNSNVLNCDLAAGVRPAFILPFDFDITNYEYTLKE